MRSPPQWIIHAGTLLHSLFRSWAVELRDQYDTLFELNLCGACAMASWALREVLRAFGEEANFCYSRWEGHAWIEWKGWVLDPTATQFGHRYRKLRCVKINSRQWQKAMYTERTAGRKALVYCNSHMSACSPKHHRHRLRTMVREVVREIQRLYPGVISSHN